MKKTFEYFGLICLICFSFFITEKTTLVVQEVDEIMINIKEDMNNYTTKGMDAIIVGDTIVPGLTGKAINVEKSYKNMKEKGLYDSSFYIYDTLIPTVSLDDNLDKYIIGGNTEKMMVSLVFIVANKSITEIQNVVGNTPISFVIEPYNIDKEIANIINASKLDNDIVILANTKDSYNLLNSKLESINIDAAYCYNDVYDSQFLELCQGDKKYSIYIDKVIDKYPLKKVKQELKAGNILAFEINDNVVKELPNIISYIKSRGYSIETLSNHLSENW